MLITLVSRRPVGLRRVYDLTVDQVHEFFAGRVLVHNCRIKHSGALTDLEDQLLSWVPGKGHSPDRLDALVHGVHALVRTERPTSLSRPRSMPLRPHRASPELERMGNFR